MATGNLSALNRRLSPRPMTCIVAFTLAKARLWGIVEIHRNSRRARGPCTPPRR